MSLVTKINNNGNELILTKTKLHVASSINFELHEVTSLEFLEGSNSWLNYAESCIRILGKTIEGKKYNYDLGNTALVIFFNPDINSDLSRFQRLFQVTSKIYKKEKAKELESFLEYDKAIELYSQIDMPKEAARVRKLKAEQSAVKVDQTVVHGDYVDDRDTIVKDSVINRSNVGSGGGSSKAEELREAKALLDEGIIDDDEFKQMKKEILGK